MDGTRDASWLAYVLRAEASTSPERLFYQAAKLPPPEPDLAGQEYVEVTNVGDRGDGLRAFFLVNVPEEGGK